MVTILKRPSLETIATVLVIVSILFNIAETAWFGFNQFPASRPEEVCHVITFLGINSGLLLLGVAWLRKP